MGGALVAASCLYASAPDALAYETNVGPVPPVKPLHPPRLIKKDRKSTEYRPAGGKLFVNGVKHSDIGQGRVGDCYFLAAASAVAQHHPDIIRNAFTHHPDGSLSVKLYNRTATGTGNAVKLEPTSIHIDRTVPVAKDSGKPIYVRSTNDRSKKTEQWPMLLEKAFAKQNKGYGPIEGGFPAHSLEVITGKPSTYLKPDPHNTDPLFNQIRQASAEGRPMVTGTWGPGQMQWRYKETTPEVRRELKQMKGGPFAQGSGLVSLHAYTVLGVSQQGKDQFVHIRNPWGSYGAGTKGFNKGPIQAEGNGIFKVPIKMFATLFQDVGIGGTSFSTESHPKGAAKTNVNTPTSATANVNATAQARR